MSEMSAVSRGCFFCKSGKEKDVVRHFRTVFPGDRAIAPTRTRYRRTREAVIEEQVPLLPSYVFFEIAEDPPVPDAADLALNALRGFSRNDSVLKLLRYNDGSWRLKGSDGRFAEMLFRADGNIDVSQAYFDEGKRIRIVSGFLKDYEGAIIRLNKKTRTAEVQVDLQGKKVSMWLGYELIAAAESGDTKQP